MCNVHGRLVRQIYYQCKSLWDILLAVQLCPTSSVYSLKTGQEAYRLLVYVDLCGLLPSNVTAFFLFPKYIFIIDTYRLVMLNRMPSHIGHFLYTVPIQCPEKKSPFI